MSLASNYAAVLKGGADLKRVVSYMVQKGHQSLLPQVLTILERGEGDTDVVRVAHEKNVYKTKTKFPGAKIIVDPSIVGGYLARKGSTLIDATYRKALVEIYKKAIA